LQSGLKIPEITNVEGAVKKSTLLHKADRKFPDQEQHYLNNKVFLWKNYRLIIVALQKYASFKKIKFPRGNYQTGSSET